MKTIKSMRLDNDVISKINKIAELERRSFSNQVECLLIDAISRKPLTGADQGNSNSIDDSSGSDLSGV